MRAFFHFAVSLFVFVEGRKEASPPFESVMATVGRMFSPDFRCVHVGRES